MDPSVLEAMDRLGRRQHGLITLRQLNAVGIGLPAAMRLVRTGRLIPVRKEVYRLCGAAPTWKGSALAAVLAGGAGAVLSHRSAAALWGLIDPRRLRGPLEITVPRRCRLDGVVAHRHALIPADVTVHHGIPVTTAERALLDLAQTCDAPNVGRHIDEALRGALTTTRLLAAVAERHSGSGRRQLNAFREALRDRGIGYDPGANDWEQRMDREWDRLGLPRAERQYRIRVAGGRTFKPDRAIVDARIAVDWNGYGVHGLRAHFDADSDRRALLAAAGWFPLDFTSRSSTRLICRTVLAVYEDRTRLG